MGSDFNFDLLGIAGSLLSWGVIAFFTYKTYQRQDNKLNGLKMIIAMLVGLFSYDYILHWHNSFIKIAILPLGVWIIYFLIRKREGSWERYRPYAWLGFFANYFLLIATLAVIPLQQWLYPSDMLSTYVAVVEKATVIATYEPIEKRMLDQAALREQLDTASKETIYSEDWYYDTYESEENEERFPYILEDFIPKFGSGDLPFVAIEKDGKGLLVTTSNYQSYFRLKQPILKEYTND